MTQTHMRVTEIICVPREGHNLKNAFMEAHQLSQDSNQLVVFEYESIPYFIHPSMPKDRAEAVADLLNATDAVSSVTHLQVVK